MILFDVKTSNATVCGGFIEKETVIFCHLLAFLQKYFFNHRKAGRIQKSFLCDFEQFYFCTVFFETVLNLSHFEETFLHTSVRVIFVVIYQYLQMRTYN